MLRIAFVGTAVSALLIVAGCGDPSATNPSAAGVGHGDSGRDPVAETVAEPPAPETGGALNIDEEGRALRGFDAVAYHSQAQPVPGDAAHRFSWNGADWWFASAEHRDAFAADPQRFAPRNGGYCTFGVVLKKKLDVDPEIFLVEDDSLYLFLNPEVQEKFLADREGNLQLVASHWPEIAEVSALELDRDGP